jgi:DNA polymerase elongation subunit (family B)
MTHIVIDIETVPAQDPAVLDEFRQSVAQNFKAPSTLTKEQAAIDLGITDKDTIKFTSKDSMLAMWAEKFKESATEAAAQEAWRKTSFDGALGHICVIGLAIGDHMPVALYHDDWHANEAQILREFFATVDKACAMNPNIQPVFIGHNLIDFDLRFIYQRAVVLGVKPSPHIPFNARPYGDRAAFDTMKAWAGVGNRVSLDKLARVLGAGGKGDIDGSMVWDYVRDGRIAEVADYCRADVEMTRAIHRRMTFEPVASFAEEDESIPY